MITRRDKSDLGRMLTFSELNAISKFALKRAEEIEACHDLSAIDSDRWRTISRLFDTAVHGE